MHNYIYIYLRQEWSTHIYHEGIFYHIWSPKKLMNWLQ